MDALETSTNKEVVYLGGSGLNKVNDNELICGRISVLKFDQGLDHIQTLNLRNQGPEGVTIIRRSQQLATSSKIFAGCGSDLYILDWNGYKLSILMIAVDLHKTSMYDMCVFGQRVYSIGKDEQSVSILEYTDQK